MSIDQKLKTDVAIAREALQREYAFEKGVDAENRIITIDEDIYEGIFNWFDAAMNMLEGLNRKKIVIKINSFGGGIYESNAIIARIKSSKCHTITEGYGKIMSAGLLILAAGKTRRGSKYATYMHHACSYATYYDKHVNNKDYVIQVEKEEDHRFAMFEEFTGTPARTWKKMAQYKDQYLTVEDCIRLGVIDESF